MRAAHSPAEKHGAISLTNTKGIKVHKCEQVQQSEQLGFWPTAAIVHGVTCKLTAGQRGAHDAESSDRGLCSKLHLALDEQARHGHHMRRRLAQACSMGEKIL